MRLPSAVTGFLQKPSRRSVIGFLQHDRFEKSVTRHIDQYFNLYPAATHSIKAETIQNANPFLPESWASPPINVYILKDVLIHSSTGIVYLPSSRSYVEEFSWGWGKTRTNQLRGSIRYPKDRSIEVDHLSYVFAGRGYHGLLEDIPALIALREKGLNVNVVIENDNLWMIRILSFLGIPNEKIQQTPKGRWIKSSSAVLVSKSPHSEYIHPELINNLSNYPVEEDEVFSSNKKIFIRRNDAGSRLHPNEEKISERFLEKGYTRLSLSKLPIAEQIAHFITADAVAGFHGAGLANIVWCKKRITVHELFSANHFNPCYFCLSQSLGHQYVLSNAET